MKSQHDKPYTDLQREALICGRCGYCRSSCPVYQSVGWESAAPRGKVSRAREIFSLGEKEKLTDDFVRRLAQCTLCGACAEACSTGIDTRRLWLDLRRRVAEAGKAPEAYQGIRDRLVKNHNISSFNNSDRLDWAEDLDEEPEDIDMKEGAEVCYFVGCVSSFYPASQQNALAIAEILTSAGVDFTTMGGEEWCCGFPLLASGFVTEAEEFMRHNVETIKSLGIHTLITGCASCYHVWKHDYQPYLGDYELEIMHATEYLARLVSEGRLEPGDLDETVTYHDPCDLGRNSGIYEAPRQIIRAIPGVSFVEMEHNRENALCCGGGGNLQSIDPDLAASIARDRVREIKETGASIIVSACQQCEQMLSAAIQKEGLKIRVMDISQLLLESL